MECCFQPVVVDRHSRLQRIAEDLKFAFDRFVKREEFSADIIQILRPSFLTPKQVQGSLEKVDERDDRRGIARQTTSKIQALIRTVLQQRPQFQTLLAEGNRGCAGVVPKVSAIRNALVLQVNK